KKPPMGWADLMIGHIVLCQEEGEDGWWQAVIVKITGTNATLRWRFEPELGGFVRPLSSLGLVQIAAAN
ncbi:hypothetical protein OFN64_40495, partial [Escherichia coli]|nr:hypothetical protein [Escherichia coli]